MASDSGTSSSDGPENSKSTPSNEYEKSPERAAAEPTRKMRLIIPLPPCHFQPQDSSAAQENPELTSDSDSSSDWSFSSEDDDDDDRPYPWGQNRDLMDDICEHPSSYNLCVGEWVALGECLEEPHCHGTSFDHFMHAYRSVRGELGFPGGPSRRGMKFVFRERTGPPNEKEMAKYPEVGTSGEPRHDADDDDDDETISLCGYKMDWPSPGVSPAVPENPPDESQGEVGKECGMEIGDPL